MVNLRQRKWPFLDAKLQADLPLRAAGRAHEIISSNPGQVVGILEIFELDPKRTDQRLRSLSRSRVEYLESEKGVLEREIERKSEPLVPDGACRAGIVGPG